MLHPVFTNPAWGFRASGLRLKGVFCNYAASRAVVTHSYAHPNPQSKLTTLHPQSLKPETPQNNREPPQLKTLNRRIGPLDAETQDLNSRNPYFPKSPGLREGIELVVAILYG